ncbi:MAG: hypothetical protein AAF675_02465 [Pseudomonadota bacterium]
MTPYIIALIYVLASLGTAWLARNTLAGGLFTFVLALLFTPLLVFPAVLIFARRSS